ncbi:hypothetical protein Gogos_008939, partial [Gossypium gossypioides]|nr:hypothetical protein [Gossypium gossypioides]
NKLKGFPIDDINIDASDAINRDLDTELELLTMMNTLTMDMICSVIVIGPSLSLHRCGLPQEIEIELFQTFVICGLIRQHLAPNIRVAKSKIWEKGSIVWEILQEVMWGHHVLLNRVLTLHRL